jgi:hypothetical protein
VVREDPTNPALLFAGTDVGVYVSTNRGEDWTEFMTGLPTAPVHDLKIHPRDRELIAATHGRSVWIVDITPLQQVAGQRLADDEPVVFDPAPGLQFSDTYSGGESTGHRYFAGESPGYGAAVHYWIPEDFEAPEPERSGDEDEARPRMRRGGMPGRARASGPQAAIAVVDAAGDTVASMNGPLSPGLHTVRWNLRPRSEGEREPLSPAERRDSLRMAAAIVEISDSLVEFEGADRAAINRALQLYQSGNLAAAFRGFSGGGAQTDPARPGERYPPEQPEWAREAEEAAETGEGEAAAAEAGEEAAEVPEEAGEEAGGASQQPDMQAVADVMRDLYYAARARGLRMSFGSFFGGGPALAEPGVYTVSVKIGDQVWTRPLRVVRADALE